MLRDFRAMLSLLEEERLMKPNEGFANYLMCGTCWWPFQCENARESVCCKCGALRAHASENVMLTIAGLVRQFYLIPPLAADVAT